MFLSKKDAEMGNERIINSTHNTIHAAAGRFIVERALSALNNAPSSINKTRAPETSEQLFSAARVRQRAERWCR
jgi:hypothetical protein